MLRKNNTLDNGPSPDTIDSVVREKEFRMLKDKFAGKKVEIGLHGVCEILNSYTNRGVLKFHVKLLTGIRKNDIVIVKCNDCVFL